jgi:hypothetical protein
MASWSEQLQRELAGRSLAVASLPGKGRGLFAARSFFPGISPPSHFLLEPTPLLRAKQGPRVAYNLLDGMRE